MSEIQLRSAVASPSLPQQASRERKNPSEARMPQIGSLGRLLTCFPDPSSWAEGPEHQAKDFGL